MTNTLAALIVDCLKSDAGVAAVAGSRVYPDVAPQSIASPYVVMSEISSVAEESHDDANGLDTTQVQFSCYATTSMVAFALRKAVRTALFANGAIIGAKLMQPISRTITADDQSITNAIFELTFMYNPST